jgi:hypothetical protein
MRCSRADNEGGVKIFFPRPDTGNKSREELDDEEDIKMKMKRHLFTSTHFLFSLFDIFTFTIS